jgi:hypothetical protein
MMTAIDTSVEENIAKGAALQVGIPVVLGIQSKTVCVSRIAVID